MKTWLISISVAAMFISGAIQATEDATVNEVKAAGKAMADEVEAAGKAAMDEVEAAGKTIADQIKAATETKPADKPVATQAKPADKPVAPQTKPADKPATTQAKPADTPAAIQTKPADKPVATEAKPTDTPVATQAKPADTPVAAQTKPADTPAATQAKPADKPAATQVKPADKPAATQAKPADESATTQTKPTDKPAAAEVGSAHKVAAKGDAAAGKAKVGVCTACHGPNGNAVVPTWPKLAGQYAPYIYKQLMDFKSGARKNSQMSPQVLSLDEQDFRDIAAYFSTQKQTPGTAVPESAEPGERIYRGGNPATGVPACTGCHGPNGAGVGAAKFPRVAGQHVQYLESTLKEFHAGTRANDPNGMMRGAVGRMSNEEITAVSRFLQGLTTSD